MFVLLWSKSKHFIFWIRLQRQLHLSAAPFAACLLPKNSTEFDRFLWKVEIVAMSHFWRGTNLPIPCNNKIAQTKDPLFQELGLAKTIFFLRDWTANKQFLYKNRQPHFCDAFLCNCVEKQVCCLWQEMGSERPSCLRSKRGGCWKQFWRYRFLPKDKAFCSLLFEGWICRRTTRSKAKEQMFSYHKVSN